MTNYQNKPYDLEERTLEFAIEINIGFGIVILVLGVIFNLWFVYYCNLTKLKGFS
ncbi:MAG: hypothetical protein KKG06_06825 [Bacteroidetes bacterium]|nr:hypothetical protein [Bacteroidota bacterium]